ncbi:MAG: hypothetical protein IJL30_01215 [Clostridia bacterium]|nr:hypothetical protein [Clostridia bacterium]
MAKQEREADKYVKDKWYQNIWYHHKAKIIIVLFLAVAIFAFVYSSLTKSDIDLYVIYITADPEVFGERISSLETTVGIFTQDITNDGRINVFVDNVYIGANHEADQVYKNKERIMTNLRAGTCFLILSDETGLEYLISSDTLCSLEEEFPDSELTGNYLDLHETHFFERPLMEDFEGNLFMSLRQFKGTIAELNSNSLKTFEQSKDVFMNIFTNYTVNIKKDE